MWIHLLGPDQFFHRLQAGNFNLWCLQNPVFKLELSKRFLFSFFFLSLQSASAQVEKKNSFELSWNFLKYFDSFICSCNSIHIKTIVVIKLYTKICYEINESLHSRVQWAVSHTERLSDLSTWFFSDAYEYLRRFSMFIF